VKPPNHPGLPSRQLSKEPGSQVGEAVGLGEDESGDGVLWTVAEGAALGSGVGS